MMLTITYGRLMLMSHRTCGQRSEKIFHTKTFVSGYFRACAFVQANETYRGRDSLGSTRYGVDGQLLDLN